MSWTPIAQFDGENVPDIPLNPGQDYMLRFELPFEVPDWIVDPLQAVLSFLIQVDHISVSGQVVEVYFRG